LRSAAGEELGVVARRVRASDVMGARSMVVALWADHRIAIAIPVAARSQVFLIACIIGAQNNTHIIFVRIALWARIALAQLPVDAALFIICVHTFHSHTILLIGIRLVNHSTGA